MSNQFVVDEFVVSLGFQETVMKNLGKLEKQVLPLANRIEKSLNKAFTVDAAKVNQSGLNRLVKNVETAGKRINKTLSSAFKIDNLGRGSLRSFENEGTQAARRIAREMRQAFNQTAPRLPAYTPHPGNRPPRPTAGDTLARNQERISELHQRQMTGAQYGQMLLRTPERATEYQSRLNALRNQHAVSGDFAQFRSGLRNLNFEFQQSSRQASIVRSQQRLAAMEASTGVSGMVSGLGAAAAALVSFQKVVQFVGDSIQEGAKRQQSKVMLGSAFGSDQRVITAAVDEYANKYGMDKATSREQAAQLRMTLPEKVFSNQDIPKLLETESVYAHQTGMNQESVGRLNYAMQQIAASAHLMGQDWMQVVNASPALIKPLQQLTKTSSTAELKAKAKSMSGADFAKLMVQAMELMTSRGNAAAAAQNNVTAAMGRYSNAVKDDQEAFFNGFNKGFQNTLNALTMSAKDSTGVMNVLGKLLGGVFNKIAATVYLADQLFSNVSGGFGLLRLSLTRWVDGQSDDLRKAFGSLFKELRGGLDSLFDSPLVRMVRVLRGSDKKPTNPNAKQPWYERPMQWYDTVASFSPMATLQKHVDRVTGAAYDVGSAAIKQSWDKGENGNLAPLVKFVSSLDEVAGNYNTGVPGFGNAPALTPMNQPVSQGQQSFNTKITLDPIAFKPLTLNIPLPDGSIYTTTAQVAGLINDHHETRMLSAQGLGGGWQGQGDNAGWNPAFLAR